MSETRSSLFDGIFICLLAVSAVFTIYNLGRAMYASDVRFDCANYGKHDAGVSSYYWIECKKIDRSGPASKGEVGE